MSAVLTPVHWFGNWCAKREDMACISEPDYPSGSKVRQYLRMTRAQQGAPMLVGCAANGCMQVYVAAAAKMCKVKGIVYVPARAEQTDATRYCLEMGAEVNEVRPGYPSVYKKRAHERAKELDKYVKWDFLGAIKDAAAQCANLPKKVKRVLIPTGSGLVAAGVLAGLAELGRADVKVIAMAASALAEEEKILQGAGKITDTALPRLELVRLKKKYDKPSVAALPDGTPLDPFYAAKILDLVEPAIACGLLVSGRLGPCQKYAANASKSGGGHRVNFRQ